MMVLICSWNRTFSKLRDKNELRNTLHLQRLVSFSLKPIEYDVSIVFFDMIISLRILASSGLMTGEESPQQKWQQAQGRYCFNFNFIC